MLSALFRRTRLDPFLLAIIVAAVVASFLPARGAGVPVLDVAVAVAVAILFFLYGARLHPKEAFEGIRHWRLHALILSFTYLAFPLLGLAMALLVPWLVAPEIYAGLLFMCLVPSTVQSSIAFTSIARGNVAGAIVSASFSNIIGVFVTPLLVLLLMATTGRAELHAGSILDIVLQLLLPFILGQLSRRWTARWVSEHSAPLKLVDRGVIVLVVYSAFSAGMREGIWQVINLGDLAVVVVISVLLLALMLWLTWALPGRLGFNREDRIAIQFCGTKKSLATGLPMAGVLFAGQAVGLVVLPLMIFHQVQLMACGALAQRYARSAPERVE